MRAPRSRAGVLAVALLLLAAACANAATPARDAAPPDGASRDGPASTLPAAPRDGASGGPPRPLSLRLSLGNNVLPLIPNSVLWLARDLGYYEREGLDVDLVELNGTPLAIAALVSGQADVANVGVPRSDRPGRREQGRRAGDQLVRRAPVLSPGRRRRGVRRPPTCAARASAWRGWAASTTPRASSCCGAWASTRRAT